MHIILLSNRLATAKSVALNTRHILLGMVLVAALILVLSSSLSWMAFRHAAEIKLPLLQTLLLSAQEQETQKTQDFMRGNLNAMAVRLGEMQAQLMRLDALGERLTSLAGIKPQEFRMNEMPGRGGAISTSFPAQNISMNEFNSQRDALSKQMENRSDYLGILENRLFDARVKKKLMPTIRPVDVNWNASSFGWRIDPITGQNAMHEGIDFLTETGTPIHAAAGGLVVVAENHHQYGYMIDIDHGNDFTTRYAHTSKLLVKPGNVVKRGQTIAEVGSTGRSTGPHLHFEVRYKGVAQNPNRFLQVTAGNAVTTARAK